MTKPTYSTIIGTGSYIPTRVVSNEDFASHTFYEANGTRINKSGKEIVDKFLEITTIAERRYVTDDLLTSDIAAMAGEAALENAGIDRELLDYIIVAHNFGDVAANNKRTDLVPCLAARVKQILKIKNPFCVAYDLPFGCPGWLQAVIQADYFLKSGDVKNILVIGADVLSRVSDPHDRDSMLYADGAGAVVLQGIESDTPLGILGHITRSDTYTHASLLHMGKSYRPDDDEKSEIYLKMSGRKLYQYALETVPTAMKACLEKCQVPIGDVKKILIHQANAKMDEAILERLYSLYEGQPIPDYIMPMSISWLGNSSVATLPTLLDLILQHKLDEHRINPGDLLLFASVGAGMHINAFVYKMPNA
ncbi:MAG: ketoacyl-ACP synthase III [Saprospiraceae bacterium]|nr:ketoacyl-ACP synthase III [Saprospiraceae bacterium]